MVEDPLAQELEARIAAHREETLKPVEHRFPRVRAVRLVERSRHGNSPSLRSRRELRLIRPEVRRFDETITRR
jgi:hypothetical protein